MLADGLLVLTFTVFAVATQITLIAPLMMVDPTWGLPPGAPAIVLWAVAFTVPLLWRRRFPCTVLAVTVIHFPFYWANNVPFETASLLVLGVAVYSAAVYGTPRRAAWCFALGWAGLSTWLLVLTLREAAGALNPFAVVLNVMYSTVPFALGWELGRATRLTRTLREYRAVLEERNAELTVEREANARRAVLEERVRIARELHDVVAHHVSLMGIQAGVAQRLFHSRPDDALEAVAAVQTGSRHAITDLHQLLGVLRGAADPGAGPDSLGTDDGCENREPAPGLGQLPALMSTVRHAGLPVDFAVQGRPHPLPPALELSTYRIVQEALTNTLKHAGAARAGVTISYHQDAAVEVEIVDDGHGPRPTAVPGGRGLVGMQERVNLHGGQLEAGPLPAGGYRVHAILGLS
jgi:signal transduction histidine kinase